MGADRRGLLAGSRGARAPERQAPASKDVPVDSGRDADLLLSYCTNHLLPIWEQWTAGNPAMRIALDMACAPGSAREHGLSDLVDATFVLFHSSRQPQSAAPLYAAVAVIYSLQGYPVDDVVEFGLQAIAMHALAEELLADRCRMA